MPLNVREERIRDLSESIKSTNETIQLLLKQKEQYANVNKFEQAPDVNSTFFQKSKVIRKLEKELEALQKAHDKSKKSKKKRSSKSLPLNSQLTQSQLSWGNSSTSSQSSDKDDDSSGGDTIVLSDSELSPVLFEDPEQHIDEKETSLAEANFREGPK